MKISILGTALQLVLADLACNHRCYNSNLLEKLKYEFLSPIKWLIPTMDLEQMP